VLSPYRPERPCAVVAYGAPGELEEPIDNYLEGYHIPSAIPAAAHARLQELRVETTDAQVSIARSRMRQAVARRAALPAADAADAELPAPGSEQWSFIRLPRRSLQSYPTRSTCNYPLAERRTARSGKRPAAGAARRRDRWVRRLNTSINIRCRRGQRPDRASRGPSRPTRRASWAPGRTAAALHDLIRQAIPPQGADERRHPHAGRRGVPAAARHRAGSHPIR
jgi:hypothetical protein